MTNGFEIEAFESDWAMAEDETSSCGGAMSARRTLNAGGAIGPLSASAYARAQVMFPAGINRITIERDPVPRYLAGGNGAWLTDVDGGRFLDLHGNFTALINGHAFPPVMEAVEAQLRSGTCFAHPTETEIDLAELLFTRAPGLEGLRFVNTGTEAVMFAVKAARAFTGRSAIAKVEGAYHGAYDWAEVSQSSTPATWGDANEPANTACYRGMPSYVFDDVVTIRFNDVEGTIRHIERNADRLAAILLDVMPSRAGLVPPEPAFIEAVQGAACRHGVLIISDEVLNFRQGFHGAAARYNLAPDLFSFGKIIGGGFPIGAVGGRADIMAVFDSSKGAPLVPQGGTFSANPISMTAGLASMKALDKAAFTRLERLGDNLRGRLAASIARHDAPFSTTGGASLLRIHPHRKAPREYRETYCGSVESAVLRRLSHHFAQGGVLAPIGGPMCLSTPMTDADIALVADLFDDFLANKPEVWGELAQAPSRPS